MKSEEIRNGVRIRKHFATSTKISEDGLFVEKEFIGHEDGNRLTRLGSFNHESKNNSSIECQTP